MPVNFFRLSGDALGHMLKLLPRMCLGRLLRVCKPLQRAVKDSRCIGTRLPAPFSHTEATPLFQRHLRDILSLDTCWEMNLLVVTADQSRLFLAKAGHLYAYPLPLEDDPTPAEVVQVTDFCSINRIGIGFMNEVEVVVCVTHEHHVTALRAHELSRPPLLAFINRDSTWSISISQVACRLAVGSNAFEIVTFQYNPQMLLRGPQHPVIKTLRGHRHNIPCISY